MGTINNRLVSNKVSGEQYSWTTPASEALETSMPVELESYTQGLLTKNSRCPSPPETTVPNQNHLITSSEYRGGDEDSDDDDAYD